MQKLLFIILFFGIFGSNESQLRSEEPQFFFVDKNSSSLTLSEGVLQYQRLPYEGYVIEKYAQGGLKSQTPYRKGRKEGEEFKYYPEGQLYEWRKYRKGKKIGIHKGWWEDGMLRFEYQFNKEGNYQGNCKEWFKNGQLFRDFNFIDGQESGQQKMYNQDGSLRANYVIKNNRKYGLQGRKKCVPAAAPSA